MAWAGAGLVSDAALGSTHPEVIRLTNLLKIYEKECMRLKESCESMEQINKNCVESLKEGESNRVAMAKQIRSLNESIKFNKIASDGIAKKAATFEFEFLNLKEERKTLIENQILDRQRLVYLEQASNDDRTKLLREMHENDVMRRKNGTLEATVASLEKELRAVRQDLILKIEKSESLAIENDQNKRVIREQSDEILKMGQDMAIMTEEKRFLTETNLTQEQYLSEKTRDARDFEEENWRLRTELTGMSRSQSEKSLAFASYRPSTTARIGGTGTGVGIGIGTGTTSMRGGTHSRKSSSSSSMGVGLGGTSGLSTGSIGGQTLPEMDIALGSSGLAQSGQVRASESRASIGSRPSTNTNNWAVNPMSSPFKTAGSVTASFDNNSLNFNHSFASVNNQTVSSVGDLNTTVGSSSSTYYGTSGNNNNININISGVAINDDIGVYFAEPPSPTMKKVVIPSKVNVNNPTLRTKYLGSGLGFTNDFNNPAQKSGGSAKQVLKKILDDFERNK